MGGITTGWYGVVDSERGVCVKGSHGERWFLGEEADDVTEDC